MEELGDLAEFAKKNATQIMIFLPHYMWAENNEIRIETTTSNWLNRNLTFSHNLYFQKQIVKDTSYKV